MLVSRGVPILYKQHRFWHRKKPDLHWNQFPPTEPGIVLCYSAKTLFQLSRYHDPPDSATKKIPELLMERTGWPSSR